MTDPKEKKENPAQSLSGTFNKYARASTEIENKFIVLDGDIAHFMTFVTEFAKNGWSKHLAGSQILSRQIDTVDLSLRRKGHTLRTRSGYISAEESEDNQEKLGPHDICLKTGSTIVAKSGALRRKEYETRLEDKEYDENSVNLDALFKAYPLKESPEHNKPLYDALKGMDPEKLHDVFRADCIRTRLILEIPEKITGLKGKKFIVELNLDDVIYAIDSPADGQAVVFSHDLEIEYEPLFEPSSYDSDHKDKVKNLVCSKGLTEPEIAQAMDGLRRYILDFANKAGIGLEENSISKANRGFDNLEKFMAHYTGPMPQSKSPKNTDSLSKIFAILSADPESEESKEFFAALMENDTVKPFIKRNRSIFRRSFDKPSPPAP